MSRISPFPPIDLNETLLIARTIWEKNAGRPMRRLTIFDTLGRSPESGPSRQLLTASSGYGLTQGSYHAEMISLHERGRAIVEGNEPQARLDAVLGVEVFRAFFENYHNAALPSETAAIDFLKEQRIPEKSAAVCLEVLLKNGRQVALIQEISGAERVVSPEHALDKLSKVSSIPTFPGLERELAQPPAQPVPLKISDEKTRRPLSLNINIQIHLPADAKPEIYETIFQNIRKHLMDEG